MILGLYTSFIRSFIAFLCFSKHLNKVKLRTTVAIKNIFSKFIFKLAIMNAPCVSNIGVIKCFHNCISTYWLDSKFNINHYVKPENNGYDCNTFALNNKVIVLYTDILALEKRITWLYHSLQLIYQQKTFYPPAYEMSRLF